MTRYLKQTCAFFSTNFSFDQVKVRFGGAPRVFSILTQEFLDNGQGHVSGVKTVNVEWTKDESGRWQMNQVPGTERVFPADLVLLAMGFLGPERAIADQLELTLDARSNFNTKEYKTNLPNVFAAGGKRQAILYPRKLNIVFVDCRRGQSLVVWAISEGRQAARRVDEFLNQGQTVLPGPGGIIQPSTNPVACPV